jgi:pimeloyl-ACP methyl ester carboxylesterase
MEVSSVSDLDFQTWGEGVPVVLVHGGIATGEEDWESQRPLAEEGFKLLVLNRHGYRPGTEGEGEDYLRDAEDVAELLGDGAHVVGHSYGGLSSMLAAAERPEAVLSLTLVEPPAFAVTDDPAVQRMQGELEAVLARAELSDRDFIVAFLEVVGSNPDEFPDELIDEWATRAPALRGIRRPWELELPLDRLRAAPFPTLVVSGGHSAAFDAVSDVLTERLGADRVDIRGAGHEVQMVAEPFNAALSALWRRVPTAG